jgi:hypothetical protein
VKFRFQKRDEQPDEERALTDDLRGLLRTLGRAEEPRLPEAERARILAATRARLDAATSARALSWSWAARVAIPGVTAIIAFFTAMHYYRDPAPPAEPAFLPALSGLTGDALDSLLAARDQAGTSDVAVAADLFDVSREAAEEYLLALDRTPLVLETLTDEEVGVLETELRRAPTAPL